MTCKDMARSARWILGLACIAALAATPFARAGIQPEPFRTGLFGVAAGQAARISVLEHRSRRGRNQPLLQIWNAAGLLLFETDTAPLPRGV